ncbi:putative ribonuclease H protein [Tanacetum coccineum]
MQIKPRGVKNEEDESEETTDDGRELVITEDDMDNLSTMTLDRKRSDHCHIAFKDMDLDIGRKPFRAFDFWLEDEEIENVFSMAWDKPVRGSRLDFMSCKKDPMRWEVEAESRSLNEEEVKFEWKRERRPRFANNRVPKLPNDDACSLEEPFSENEVWNAEDVNWFWEKAVFSKGCNASFVTLVSKVSAFIEERYILDSVLIANETIEFLKRKKMKGIVFKVDFKKASDSIDWCYLMEIMDRMGFGSRWRKWVLACLRSTSISILVNRSPTNEFYKGRGVRQGDPLSPFLFILVTEGLNVLLVEVVDKNIFEATRVGKDEVMVSHLQYADDTIVFGEWSRENACNLMNVLKCFKYVVGLKIGADGAELDRMARFMRCGVGEFPFTYLGLPIGVNIGERQVTSLAGVIKMGWNEIVPVKINVFIWRAVLGRLPLRMEFDKKRIFPRWGLFLVDAFTLNDMICHRGGVDMEKEARVLWEVVLLVAAYYILLSRNLRVFKVKNESSSKVFQDIQIKTFE